MLAACLGAETAVTGCDLAGGEVGVVGLRRLVGRCRPIRLLAILIL